MYGPAPKLNGQDLVLGPAVPLLREGVEAFGLMVRVEGKPNGTLMSRSEVTKGVNNYVKEKNLKEKHDIKADAPLRKLLSITEAEHLTYFNLQRFLNRHYVKATPAA